MAAKRHLWRAIILGIWALFFLLSQSTVATMAQQPRGPIYTVEASGTITSVTIDYLRRALQLAESADASVLIIRLSSSGGVLRDIRPFAGEIVRARVPVVVYVTPSGTQSGAVGAFFLSASHMSALAPDTSFGSPYPLTEVDAALTEQTRNLVLDSVTDQLRTWNAQHGRNTEWVERAVRQGVVLTNEQASAATPPAVDIVTTSQEELLTLLEGRTIKLADGRDIQLHVMGQNIVAVEPTLWEWIRLTLATPSVAFILLVLGALAIYLEFGAPGTSFFVGIGIVMLAGATLGLIVLPIRWWSLLLLLFALGLVGAEFFIPTHGGMAVTGLALLVVGALNLIDPVQAPGTFIAVWIVLLVVFALASFAALGLWLALRNRAHPITTGQEALIGKLAQVRQRLEPDGMVFVEGALWQAMSENGTVEEGDWVRIMAIHELRLIVQRLDTEGTKS